MKQLITLLTAMLFTFTTAFAQFNLGENVGYYGARYTDQQLYDLMWASGTRATRSEVTLQQDLQYGMATFQARLQYPYSTKGMRNNCFILDVSAGPTYVGQSTTKTSGGHQTWLPNGLYDTAFNTDGSINTANLWGKYVYDVIQSVGPYFTYYEVWNEPDITGTPDAYTPTSQDATSWQAREPTADELTNMYATVEDYVQLCKIARAVIKKYQPTAKVCTGGIGYPYFYQWFLTKGGGQYVDILSFHTYPYFDWCVCVFANNACGPAGFHRNSDYAVQSVLTNHLGGFRTSETVTSSTHLPAILTETNVPRWSYVPSGDLEVFPNNKTWGAEETQRNYDIKVWAKTAQAGVQMLFFYQLGETGDSGLNNGSSGSEIDAMGLYKNLQKSTLGQEQFTTAGLSVKTLQSLLTNYIVNVATIPGISGTNDGVEFDSTGGKQAFIAWVITTADLSETTTPSTLTLPAGKTFKGYTYSGALQGTYTGTAPLTGDPLILVQSNAVTVGPDVTTSVNQTITLPLDSTSISATVVVGSSPISTEGWTKISGGAATIRTPSATSTEVAGLAVGTYIFQFKATDGNSLSDSGRVTITVDSPQVITPKPPVANAGSPQTVQLPLDSVFVSGAASTDSGGSITVYTWSQLSGPATGLIRKPTNVTTWIANLTVAGSYVYKLVVTNDSNLKDSTTVTITVTAAAPAKQPPVGHITGTVTPISLPRDTVILNGSTSTDPNGGGSISSYNWSISVQPRFGRAHIRNATAEVTSAYNMTAVGTYTFRLIVTNNFGIKDTVTTKVVVNSRFHFTSIRNPELTPSITLLPNPVPAPTTVSLEMDSEDIGQMTIRIFNIAGVPVQTIYDNKQSEHYTKLLDVSNFANGIYFVTILFATASYNSKLIVMK